MIGNTYGNLNYHSMSDDEINKRVAVKLSSFEKWEFSFCGGSVLNSNKKNDMQPVYDFCNDISKAWPIMVENGISNIANAGKLVDATTDSQEYFESFGGEIYTHNDKNPIRAAMIVYLIMNESENKRC